MQKILVVDDEPSMRELLGIMLRKEGFTVEVAESRATAALALARGPVDLVITDVKLPDGDGIEILRHLRAASPETVVIVMTAFGSTETAVAALKLGAQDYLIKPFDMEELKIVVRNALEKQQLQDENLRFKAEFRVHHGLESIIGVAPPMVKVFELIRSVAATSSTVLLQGESGTGKELVAKALHSLSPRRDAPFVSINCAALPEALLESELFGHMRGAFTDAHQTKKGLFETAHRGTLLLDEVGEMPLPMQAKLLRVLQDGEIARVGGAGDIRVDVRVISATNKDIDTLLSDGRFREDLYYRLSTITVKTPPLREHAGDVPALAAHFVEAACRRNHWKPRRLSPEAMAVLAPQPWKGNVRELRNVVERLLILSDADPIGAADVRAALPADGAAPRAAPPPATGGLRELADAFERDVIRERLRLSGGHVTNAARSLGLERSHLYKKCKQLGIDMREET
jgi:DNA-binding NtrC family response regulator